MTEDSVVALHHPGVTADPLTEVLRAGARELLARAIEAEVAAVLAAHEHLKLGFPMLEPIHAGKRAKIVPDWQAACC